MPPPSHSQHWLASIPMVLRIPLYSLSAAVTSLLFMIISFSLAIRSVLAFSLTVPVASFGSRLRLLAESVMAIPLSLSPLAIIFIIIIAMLAGINVALVVYYFRKRMAIFSGSATGLLGLVSAVLGVGCASCGSVILSSVIGLSASSAVISFLPLRGEEFNLLAVILLLYSIHLVAKKLIPENLLACKI